MPVEAIAAQAGIPLKRLMKISAPQGDAQARVDEIAAVTRVTGRTGWMRFYVRLAGCELFQLPNAPEGSFDAEAITQVSASLKSMSSVVETLNSIVADRRIRPDERIAFDEVIGTHFAAVRHLQAWVAAREDAETNVRRFS
ncbi:MAG TPA: phage regulatory CII family protein [Gemmatimonadales bacterium]|nr:phage regulatory CII family protein [Gemmatimonadales bacterium]